MRIWTSGFMIMMWLAPLVALAAPPAYEIRDLGTLGTYPTARSAGFAVNNAGEVVGWSDQGSAPNSGSVPFVWSEAQGMTNLGLHAGLGGTAYGITSQGDIAMSFSQFENATPTVRYADGTWDVLPDFDYGNGTLRGVNDALEVVGYADTGAGGPSVAAFWTKAGGSWQITQLPSAGAAPDGEARAINEAGVVVGSSGGQYATRWSRSGGTWIAEDLGALSAESGAVASGINDLGQIVGWSAAPRPDGWPPEWGPPIRAFVWVDGEMTNLGAIGTDLHSVAMGVNELGHVVGWSGDPSGTPTNPFGQTRACLYRDNQIYSLIDLIPAGSGWNKLGTAFGINDADQIVGWGLKGIGLGAKMHAYLMTPVPEPASLLMLLAVGMLGMRRAR